MAASKEQRLWQACTDGDFDTMKELVDDPAVQINWAGEDRLDTSLHRACRFGRTKVAKELLRNPRIEVNKLNTFGCTPFFIACQEGSTAIVEMLLGDSRVDVRWPHLDGHEPFFKACSTGQKEIVSLLLADPRIDPNKPWTEQRTPLWQATQNGHLSALQHLLASHREIDTKMRHTFNNKTAAGQGRAMGRRTTKVEDETEEVFRRRKTNGPLCADLVDEYERDPVAVRDRLRRQPGLREYFSGHLLALVVFHSDNFVVIKKRTAHSDTKRFFKMTSRLPLELQMVLCNRVFGSPKDIILSRDSEPGFKCLARTTTWQ